MAFEPVGPFYISMACLTLDVLFYMAFMVEHDMLGDIKNFFPRCGRLGIKIIMLFSYFRVVWNDKVVTVKAFFNRRDSRVNGPVYI